MKTKNIQLHSCFIKFRDGTKTKVKCRYCGYIAAENVSRMKEHLNKCKECPPRPESRSEKPSCSNTGNNSVSASTSKLELSSPSDNLIQSNKSPSQTPQSSLCDEGRVTRPIQLMAENIDLTKKVSAITAEAEKASQWKISNHSKLSTNSGSSKMKSFCDRMSPGEQEKIG